MVMVIEAMLFCLESLLAVHVIVLIGSVFIFAHLYAAIHVVMVTSLVA
jgi:hypothetical protein